MLFCTHFENLHHF